MSNWFSWLQRLNKQTPIEELPDPWLPLVTVMQDIAAKEQKELERWRQKFLRMRQKRNNKRQTLAATRLRLEEAYEDLAAMRRERDEANKELEHYRSMCEMLSVELEELKK